MTFSYNRHEYVILNTKFCEKLIRNVSILIGLRYSGKTNLMFNIAKCIENEFENIIYTSSSDKQNDIISKILEKSNILKNQQTLLILDNYSNFDNKDFIELLINHKYLNITIIISTQLSPASSIIYSNIDNFFINNHISHSECQRLWSKIGNNISNSFEDFKQKIQNKEEKYNFCYFGKNTNNINYINNTIYKSFDLDNTIINNNKLSLFKEILNEITNKEVNSKEILLKEKINLIKKLCLDVEELINSKDY